MGDITADDLLRSLDELDNAVWDWARARYRQGLYEDSEQERADTRQDEERTYLAYELARANLVRAIEQVQS